MSLAFLSKKSWHTATIKNTEKVWIAEQREADEKKRMQELQKQLAEERQVMELKQLQKDAGHIKHSLDRLDWMYEAPMQAGPSSDDYLTGKVAIDSKEEEEEYKRAVSTYSDVAGSKLMSGTAPSANDMFRKISEDPMMAIKMTAKLQQESILRNPVLMAKLREAVQDKKEKKQEKKPKKEKKSKQEKKSKKSKRSSEGDGGSTTSDGEEEARDNHDGDRDRDSRDRKSDRYRDDRGGDDRGRASDRDRSDRDRGDRDRGDRDRNDRDRNDRRSGRSRSASPRETSKRSDRDRGGRDSDRERDRYSRRSRSRSRSRDREHRSRYRSRSRSPESRRGDYGRRGGNDRRDGGREGDRHSGEGKTSSADSREKANSMDKGTRSIVSTTVPPPAHHHPKSVSLSSEEKALKLRAMMQDADRNDDLRWKRVKSGRDAEKEMEVADSADTAPTFLAEANKVAYSSEATDSMKDRLSRQRHYQQKERDM